jgi:16S rRNA (cytidine1402-2'-O)-methyltransferase
MTPASQPPGLYVVATPIGNLGDISARAVETLRGCALIACEDTRVTAKLVQRFGLGAPLTPYHDHSDEAVRPRLVEAAAHKAVALVSDAGTPLISDPGYKLVRDCKAAGVAVFALPGACAAIAALSVSGLPSDRFLFAGFPPAKPMARRQMLRELASVRATLIFYESPARLADSLKDMLDMLGDRPASIAREITKLHETLYDGTLATLAAHFAVTAVKGELVIIAGPPLEDTPADEPDVDALLIEALTSSSLKQAVASVTAATGLPRKQVYARALQLAAGSDAS